MDAYQFEFLIGDLLQELGYENVEVTKHSGDKGINATGVRYCYSTRFSLMDR